MNTSTAQIYWKIPAWPLLALAVGFCPVGAVAQGDGSNAVSEGEARLEEVIVRGIRDSIRSAQEEKRRANQLLDSIAEEDIGKLPDQNIAEALQRVTGVQIGRALGEGSAVAVRGLAQNRVEVNGRTTASSEGDRGVNFSLLASELFGSVEVVKSPTADQIEGALGGTINLKTRKPFDAKGRVASLNLKGIYTDDADDYGVWGSAYVSDRFETEENGEFGVSLALAYNDTSRQEQNTQLRWQRRAGDTGNARGFDADGDGMREPELYVPQRFVSQTRLREQERIGATLNLQWRPNDQWEVFLTGEHNSLEHDTLSYIAQFTINQNSRLQTSEPKVITANNTVLQGTFSNVPAELNGWNQPTESETESVALGFEWDNDLIKVSGEISKADGGREFLNSFMSSKSNCTNSSACDKIVRNPTLTYDITASGDLPSLSLTKSDGTSYSVSTLDEVVINNYFGQDQERETNDLSMRVDMEYRLEQQIEFLDSIEVGVRFSDGNNRADRTIINLNQNRMLTNSLNNKDPDSYPQLVLEPAVKGFLSGVSGGWIKNYATINPSLATSGAGALASLYGFDVSKADYDELFHYDVSEETLAGYVKLNFSGDAGRYPFRGNIGVRVVETKVDSEGFQQSNVSGEPFLPLSIKPDYVDVLPSLNVAFDATDDVIVRFAAAKVISRPPLTNLAVGSRLNFGDDTGSSGNPELDPFRADQYDISAEWYFAEASLLNVGLFYKDIESYITMGEVTESRLNPGSNEVRQFQLRVPINGKGGEVKGFEIGYSHAFISLPAPFDGFGIVANYTHVDSETPNVNVQTGEKLSLEDLSEDSYNLIAYYERGPFKARLAYNYRSDFLDQTAGFHNQPVYEEKRGQLDASASWAITEKILIQFEAINMTDEHRERHSAISERFYGVVTDEQQYSLGVRMRL